MRAKREDSSTPDDGSVSIAGWKFEDSQDIQKRDERPVVVPPGWEFSKPWKLGDDDPSHPKHPKHHP